MFLIRDGDVCCKCSLLALVQLPNVRGTCVGHQGSPGSLEQTLLHNLGSQKGRKGKI